MSHSPFAAAFTHFARERGGPLVMATREIGRLRVTSGRIIGDPMITSADPTTDGPHPSGGAVFNPP